MVEVGKVYYFITHAYFKYVAVVESIDGRHDITPGRCLQIIDHPKGWQDWFDNGITAETKWAECPEGGSLTFIRAIPYQHELPKKRKR